MEVFLDADSTLLKSTDAWHDWVKKTYHVDFELGDVETYDWIQTQFGINTMEWWKDKDNYDVDIMKPFDGAVEFVEEVIDLVGYKKTYIATYSFDNIQLRKTNMLDRIFDVHFDHIIHSRRKWEHTYTGILIDDNINNCLVHNAVSNMPAVLFNLEGRHPWSDKDIMRKLNPYIEYAESYDEVLTFLKRIYGRNKRS